MACFVQRSTKWLSKHAESAQLQTALLVILLFESTIVFKEQERVQSQLQLCRPAYFLIICVSVLNYDSWSSQLI